MGLSLDFYGSGFPTFSCDDTGGVTTIYNPAGWSQIGVDGICFTDGTGWGSYKAVCMDSSSLLSPYYYGQFPPGPPMSPGDVKVAFGRPYVVDGSSRLPKAVANEGWVGTAPPLTEAS